MAPFFPTPQLCLQQGARIARPAVRMCMQCHALPSPARSARCSMFCSDHGLLSFQHSFPELCLESLMTSESRFTCAVQAKVHVQSKGHWLGMVFRNNSCKTIKYQARAKRSVCAGVGLAYGQRTQLTLKPKST